jgi:type IV secretory pathway VirJ component
VRSASLRRLGLLLVAAACGAGPVAHDLDAGRLGRVHLFVPTEPGVALVFVFSDARGWSPALAASARELAREGVAVVGVDLPQYLAGLAASSDGCHYVVAELEALSHRLEREIGFETYRSPILAGVGAGGTLAYAALAQSPAATVAGALSVGPADALATRVPLCPGAPALTTFAGFRYGAQAALTGFWRPEIPPEPAPLPRGEAAARSGSPEQRLVALLRAALAATPARADSLADLPLVELAAERAGPRAAIIYSGDGGWRDLDKQIGEVLSRHGTPVVGVDSLRYFWREKTPDQIAGDLSRILRHCRERFGASEFILVGYSFGAGIVPFAVNRLPEADRAAVVQVSLLGLGPLAPFEFRVVGWLGGREGAERPVLPEVRRLDLARVQCVFGEEETDTLCRDPALRGSEVIGTRGGHHFDGDYVALAGRILEGAERRSRARDGG